MCVVVDADTFTYFSNPHSSRHGEFQPIIKWVRDSNCKYVYGGTTYTNQLNKHKDFRDFLKTMWQAGKTVDIGRQKVDQTERVIRQTITGPGYNDHHIVAIVLISRCKVVCSLDSGLKNLIDECYSSSGRTTIMRQLGIRKPRKPNIYSGRGSASTLRRRTSSSNCGPCCHT
jgi:hypothetical protein